jgi:transposase
MALPGIAEFIAIIDRLDRIERLVLLDRIERLVLEPTGGYERCVVEALLAASLPVALLRGKRMIAGGRKPVRAALYIAALPTIRFDPDMKALFERLKSKGKPGKAALVAVMRR